MFYAIYHLKWQKWIPETLRTGISMYANSVIWLGVCSKFATRKTTILSKKKKKDFEKATYKQFKM